jgi:hypothetical protein
MGDSEDQGTWHMKDRWLYVLILCVVFSVCVSVTEFWLFGPRCGGGVLW